MVYRNVRYLQINITDQLGRFIIYVPLSLLCTNTDGSGQNVLAEIYMDQIKSNQIFCSPHRIHIVYTWYICTYTNNCRMWRASREAKLIMLLALRYHTCSYPVPGPDRVRRAARPFGAYGHPATRRPQKTRGRQVHWGQPREASIVKMAPTRPLASRSFCLLAPLCDHRSLSNLQQSNTRAWYTLHQIDRLVPLLVFVQ